MGDLLLVIRVVWVDAAMNHPDESRLACTILAQHDNDLTVCKFTFLYLQLEVTLCNKIILKKTTYGNSLRKVLWKILLEGRDDTGLCFLLESPFFPMKDSIFIQGNRVSKLDPA